MILNVRLFAILILGFASGMPLALTGSTLQAWLTEANVKLSTIGALSLIGLPYTLKFLWAPLLDHYKWPVFTHRKGWILLTQIGLIITLLYMATLKAPEQVTAISLTALLVAFLSASQDIAINAYQAAILPPEERGLGAAYSIFAYRLAMLVSGGLALIFAAHWGWQITYYVMAGLLFITMLFTFTAPEFSFDRPSGQNLFGTLQTAFFDLLQRENILLILLFILFYKFGDALALQLMTNFLLHGLHFTLTEVGLAYKTVSFAATIFGAFLGGLMLTRMDLYAGLLIFGIAQACSTLLFAILALAGKSFGLMISAIFIENFCSGLSTAALLAFMMLLCHRQYTASQFALLSAIASLGRVFLGPAASFMVENLGWVEFYLWSFILSFPGIIFLLFLKNKSLFHEYAISN